MAVDAARATQSAHSSLTAQTSRCAVAPAAAAVFHSAAHARRSPAAQPNASSASSSSFSSASASSASDSSTDSIDFGHRRVPVSAKQGLVHSVFARVAHRYDLMNDLMSGGMHRLWKFDLVHNKLSPAGDTKHLDVAGGTGDVAFRVLMAARKAQTPPGYSLPPRSSASSSAEAEAEAEADRYARSAQVICCDINDNMLQVGIERAKSQYGLEPGALIKPAPTPAAAAATAASASSAAAGAPASPVELLSPARIFSAHGPLAFVSGNAEHLPFLSGSFDSYTIVFGLRNVTHRDRALREALRVLKPGGRFLCMEFSAVTMPGLDKIYEAYSAHVIPALGEVVADDRASYQYLVESIAQMPDQEELAAMIRQAGFMAVSYDNLQAGIVAVHQGFKPM